MRARLAIDPALTTLVLGEFIAGVTTWLRRRARRLGIRGEIKTGAVTVIQRFNSALDVAPHFHRLFPDGAYTFPPGRRPIFHPLPSPTDDDIASVAGAVFRRVERHLQGRELAVAQSDFVEGAPLLVAVTEASARGVIATGPRRGCRVLRVRGLAADVDAFVMGRLCAQVEGYNLQAAPGSPPTIARRSSAWAGTSHGLPSRRIVVAARGRARRAAPQAPLARRHHGVSVHGSRAHRAARGDSAQTTHPPGPLPWCPGSSVRGAIRDRAIEAGRDGRDIPAPGSTRGRGTEAAGKVPLGVAHLAGVS